MLFPQLWFSGSVFKKTLIANQKKSQVFVYISQLKKKSSDVSKEQKKGKNNQSKGVDDGARHF